MKVSELTGVEMDYWVARAEGLRCEVHARYDGEHAYIFIDTAVYKGCPRIYQPSKDWSEAGPIIDAQDIVFIRATEGDGVMRVFATCYNVPTGQPFGVGKGETRLIAAMRAYVGSKLGNEIEVPKELT